MAQAPQETPDWMREPLRRQAMPQTAKLLNGLAFIDFDNNLQHADLLLKASTYYQIVSKSLADLERQPGLPITADVDSLRLPSLADAAREIESSPTTFASTLYDLATLAVSGKAESLVQKRNAIARYMTETIFQSGITELLELGQQGATPPTREQIIARTAVNPHNKTTALQYGLERWGYAAVGGITGEILAYYGGKEVHPWDAATERKIVSRFLLLQKVLPGNMRVNGTK